MVSSFLASVVLWCGAVWFHGLLGVGVSGVYCFCWLVVWLCGCVRDFVVLLLRVCCVWLVCLFGVGVLSVLVLVCFGCSSVSSGWLSWLCCSVRFFAPMCCIVLVLVHASGCCSFGGRSSGVALSAVLSRSGLFFFLLVFLFNVFCHRCVAVACVWFCIFGLVVSLLVVSGSVFSSSVFVVSFFHQFYCFSWCSCFLLFGVVVESVCVPLDVCTGFFFRPFLFFSCGCSVVVLCGFHLVVCWFSVLHRCSFLVSHVVVWL